MKSSSSSSYVCMLFVCLFVCLFVLFFVFFNTDIPNVEYGSVENLGNMLGG